MAAAKLLSRPKPLLFLFFLCTNAAFAQPVFEFEEVPDSSGRYLFTDTVSLSNARFKDTLFFSNTGNEPLIISQVVTSDPCYCCWWPPVPIYPGEGSYLVICYPARPAGSRVGSGLAVRSNSATDPHLQFTVRFFFIE